MFFMDYLEWGFVHHLADINVEFHVPSLIPTAVLLSQHAVPSGSMVLPRNQESNIV
jgi:hypothetical protein